MRNRLTTTPAVSPVIGCETMNLTLSMDSSVTKLKISLPGLERDFPYPADPVSLNYQLVTLWSHLIRTSQRKNYLDQIGLWLCLSGHCLD